MDSQVILDTVPRVLVLVDQSLFSCRVAYSEVISSRLLVAQPQAVVTVQALVVVVAMQQQERRVEPVLVELAAMAASQSLRALSPIAARLIRHTLTEDTKPTTASLAVDKITLQDISLA
jgi:hypothetical protein